MIHPSERERRLQAVWERAAARIETAFSQREVTLSMLAASFKRLVDLAGPEGAAQHLGRLAVACHEAAGGEFDDEGEIAPEPRGERTRH